jgi:hypothetical protein
MKNPNCGFIRGTDRTNIPIHCSIKSLPYKRYGSVTEVINLKIYRSNVI